MLKNKFILTEILPNENSMLEALYGGAKIVPKIFQLSDCFFFGTDIESDL